MAKQTKAAAKTTAKLPTPKALGLPSNVKSVVSMTKDGRRAKRVIVRCTDKQPEATCLKTREVATQDVFQVARCTACQVAFLRVRRRAANKTLRARSLKRA